MFLVLFFVLGTEYRPAAELPELSCPDSEPERGKYLTGRFQTLALCLEALLRSGVVL